MPSIDENGEAGNLGANNYIKGDSCNFASLSVDKDLKMDQVTKPLLQQLLVAQVRRPLATH